MNKLFLLIILSGAFALNTSAQSGRRITPQGPTQTAPVQPSLNPEPEPQPAVAPVKLVSLPESLLERKIAMLPGGTFRFADFNGKVLVINLWASWCGPCRREVPEYEKVRKAYAGRNVEFIGLTTEDPSTSSDRVNKFLRDVNFGFRLGWADSETAFTLMNGKRSIPQTLVVDAGGRIVSQWSGYSPGQSGDRLRQAIDHALESAR